MDSNVVVKLTIKEPGSEDAKETLAGMLRRGVTLYTTEVALPEGLNALWKHATIHGDISEAEYREAVSSLARLVGGLKTIPTPEIAEESAEVALREKVLVYDALYITAAKRLGGTLVTADVKLQRLASKTIDTRLIALKEANR